MNPAEIGHTLKEAREEKKLSIENAYKTTHIQPRIIRALEEGTADEHLNRVYVLLFLKKYADFLYLDGSNLVNDYKSFYREDEKQAPEPADKKFHVKDEPEKWITLAITSGLIILVLVLLVALGMGVRRLASKKSVSVPEGKTAVRSSPEAKEGAPFPVPANKPIDLSLTGNNDVWMRIKADGKTVFTGTLGKGETGKWTAKYKMELWVGRAEALDFTVNGRLIGKVGAGSVKDIQIFKSGIKIGNKWLIKKD